MLFLSNGQVVERNGLGININIERMKKFNFVYYFGFKNSIIITSIMRESKRLFPPFLPI